jgi:hypothetical protein
MPCSFCKFRLGLSAFKCAVNMLKSIEFLFGIPCLSNFNFDLFVIDFAL